MEALNFLNSLSGIVNTMGASPTALANDPMVNLLTPKCYDIPVDHVGLTGFCDWSKIQAMSDASHQLSASLRNANMVNEAKQVDEFLARVVSNRMAAPVGATEDQFMRDTCANDLVIQQIKTHMNDITANILLKSKVLKELPLMIKLGVRNSTNDWAETVDLNTPLTGWYNAQPNWKPVTQKYLDERPKVIDTDKARGATSGQGKIKEKIFGPKSLYQAGLGPIGRPEFLINSNTLTTRQLGGFL